MAESSSAEPWYYTIKTQAQEFDVFQAGGERDWGWRGESKGIALGHAVNLVEMVIADARSTLEKILDA